MRKRLTRLRKVFLGFFVPGFEWFLVFFRGKSYPSYGAAEMQRNFTRDTKLKSFPYDPFCGLFGNFR
tara:strand:+ start:151 stop:351 length:201 start_codon:yes stop_codon:yes gene_type:complete